MIALLVTATGVKPLEKVVYFVASLVVVLLVGSSVLGMLTQPWVPWWLSGGKATIGDLPLASSAAPTPVSPHVAPPAPVAVAPVPTLAPLPPTSVIEGVIARARTWLGVPYLWGGCTMRGVDCSCFVQNAFGPFVSLPRTTTQQIQVARPVNASAARAGDLVFFDNTCTGCGANPTHVGIYLGGGMMIDAGDPVQIERVYGGHNARYGRVLE